MIKTNATMTQKRKTVLFALIVAMILPFSGINFAEANEDNNKKYELADISTAMLKADPYIIQVSHIVIFDIEDAQDTMLMEEIEIINDFVEMQNKYVTDYKTYRDQKPQFDEDLEEKFEELRHEIQSSESDISEINFLTNWLLPEIHAAPGDVCGGSSSNPHSEYAKKIIASHATEQAAKNDPVAKGYHIVPITASWSYGLDYALFTTEYNCNADAFRNQIVIQNNSTHWNLNKQIKEPNPEITAYTHPVWWWTFYTVSWHTSTTNPVVTNW